MAKPDWYSDGHEIRSEPFDHNGFVARPLFTQETMDRALVQARKDGMKEAATELERGAAAMSGCSIDYAASEIAAAIRAKAADQ